KQMSRRIWTLPEKRFSGSVLFAEILGKLGAINMSETTFYKNCIPPKRSITFTVERGGKCSILCQFVFSFNPQ
ncbi:MAG: hypothetical protein RRY34_10060, partial [Victivallaceae bacterium]